MQCPSIEARFTIGCDRKGKREGDGVRTELRERMDPRLREHAPAGLRSLGPGLSRSSVLSGADAARCVINAIPAAEIYTTKYDK